jgi:hypothetical protein
VLTVYVTDMSNTRYKAGRFTSLETRAVLAGAYRGGIASTLTHSYDVDADRTLCNRVKAESIADTYADDIDAAPTCPACLEKMAAAS